MTEADVIQPSASIASTGPGIRYIGEYCYAFSGFVGVNNVETTLLEFTSGAGLIVADIQCNLIADTADDQKYVIYLNDIEIMGYLTLGAQQSTDSNNVMQILIPPFSILKVTGINATDTSTNNNAVTLVGRVYGAT